MPTQAEQVLKAQIIRDLRESGCAWGFVGEWPTKATYYKSTGEAMPNLPADPWSMKRYLNRGFTLAPPVEQGLVCDVCGKSGFTHRVGLAGHKRTHKKE